MTQKAPAHSENPSRLGTSKWNGFVKKKGKNGRDIEFEGMQLHKKEAFACFSYT